MSLSYEEINKLQTDKSKVYALLFKGQLSQESLDKAKRMADWNVIDGMCAPPKQGKGIIAIHQVRAGVDEEKTKWRYAKPSTAVANNSVSQSFNSN